MGFMKEACNKVITNFWFLFSSRLIESLQDDFFKVVNRYYNWELTSANTFLLMRTKFNCPCDSVISCTPTTLASMLFFLLAKLFYFHSWLLHCYFYLFRGLSMVTFVPLLKEVTVSGLPLSLDPFLSVTPTFLSLVLV